MTAPRAPLPDDMVSASELGRAVRRGWWIIALCTAAGVLSGAVVLHYAAPVWTAKASVLVRDASPLPGALAQQIGEGAASGAASLLGGALRSSVETDMALLRSRDLAGTVVDSLGLQVVVAEPRGTPPARVVRRTDFHAPFRPLKLRMDAAEGGGVHVFGKDVDTTIARGSALLLPAGSLLLADSVILPATIQLFDREDAITRSLKRLDVVRTGGDVVGVGWPAEDSLSAPAAANLLIEQFLLRRRGVDRSLNERRLEFVSHQNDSVDRALDVALAKQRDFHEKAGTVDPAGGAKAYLESLIRLREQRETLVMEETALAHLQGELAAHTVQPRQLAAYPAFLRSPAINELLGRIGALEADRASLLERQRREDDPAVAAVRASIAKLEAELEPLARTYVEAVGQQRTSLDSEIALVNAQLAKVPDQLESAYQHAREVERLSRTSLALNAQRVELRLATIGEGGEARTVDVAHVQWKRTYPSKMLTLLMGLIAGLAVGVAIALMRPAERRAGA